MARLSFKPDSSFFRKIVIGAVGARGVCSDLAGRGHEVVELERGATDTKLWKEVKRKRVRIPDLVCSRCGVRVECRTKTRPELSMSHSPTDAERAWDYGMVDGDWIAFPVCLADKDDDWSRGALARGVSYWRQENRSRWQVAGYVNYFRVGSFRASLHARSSTKSGEEGAETFIGWDAIFSSRDGVVEAVAQPGARSSGSITVRRHADGHAYTWRVKPGSQVAVSVGDAVVDRQVLASPVTPLTSTELVCAGSLPTNHLAFLLQSRERTQRFAGVKLARLRGDGSSREAITSLHRDPEEDVYVRLEAASYLASVCACPASDAFGAYLASADEQTQLEAVIALGEAATDSSVALLSEFVSDPGKPYFLRSAAAWSLSQTGSGVATQALIRTFGDVDLALREEALDGLVSLGAGTQSLLLSGLHDADPAVRAGCAEALRQHGDPPARLAADLVAELRSPEPEPWAVWLAGHLPREHFRAALAELQEQKPELHYALSLLWSFVESWIARHWELHPEAGWVPA
jgi:HEAT repeat protein